MKLIQRSLAPCRGGLGSLRASAGKQSHIHCTAESNREGQQQEVHRQRNVSRTIVQTLASAPIAITPMASQLAQARERVVLLSSKTALAKLHSRQRF